MRGVFTTVAPVVIHRDSFTAIQRGGNDLVVLLLLMLLLLLLLLLPPRLFTCGELLDSVIFTRRTRRRKLAICVRCPKRGKFSFLLSLNSAFGKTSISRQVFHYYPSPSPSSSSFPPPPPPPPPPPTKLSIIRKKKKIWENDWL